MEIERRPFTELISHIVDNRGRTCPVSDAGIALIATNCIRNDRLYPAREGLRYVSEETYRDWFRGHPKPGDLILVTKGSPGRVCMTPDPVDFCIAQDMVAVRADPSRVYPPYLFAILRSEPVQRQIENMHVGTLIPHFKKGDFNKLKIPMVSEPEQRFIGDLYLGFSRKIEFNRRMNQTLEEIARTLFKSWFVDFDPVHAKAAGRQPEGMDAETTVLFPDAFEESSQGPIPLGWAHSSLREVATVHDSKRVPLSSRERAVRQGPFPYYGATAVLDYVDDYLFDGVHVLVGEDGSVMNDDGTPVIQYVWGQFWVNNHAHVLTARNGPTNEHLYLALRHANVRAFVTGAVQAKINQSNLLQVPFTLPPTPVSEAFGGIIEPLIARIRANEEESRTLTNLRDTLLPRLLSKGLNTTGCTVD